MFKHIIIRWDFQQHLLYSLMQSAYMGNDIILITDIVDIYEKFLNKNIKSDLLSKINIININDFYSRADNFSKYYEHYSTNPHWFELRCLQRWFVLLDFLNKNKFNGFLYTDCDVLFFGKVKDEINKIKNYDIGLGSSFGIGVMLGINFTFLNEYIKLVENCYIKKENYYFYILKEWKEFQEKKMDGGICDMRFFNFLYENRRDLKILSLSDSVINNEIYDKNLSETTGYIKENSRKKIWFENDLPYVFKENNKKLNMKTLHCSAVNKPLMKDLISPCLKDL